MTMVQLSNDGKRVCSGGAASVGAATMMSLPSTGMTFISHTLRSCDA